MHLWLAPFTPGGKHSISITFAESIRIAMIRIWVSSSYVTGFRHKNLLLSFTGCIFIAYEQPSLIALQDAHFSTERRLETSWGEVCRGLASLIEDLSRDVFEKQTATGRRIKLTLARFNVNASTVSSAFWHFELNYTDQKGVLNSWNKSC